jgi:hypothetical protein
MPDPKRRGVASPAGLLGGAAGGGPLVRRALLLVPLVLGGLALLLQVREGGWRRRGARFFARPRALSR